MNIRDAQVLIPGWNAVYLARKFERDYHALCNEVTGGGLDREQAEVDREQAIADRELALACGDFQRARKLDEKIARLTISISHVNRIA